MAKKRPAELSRSLLLAAAFLIAILRSTSAKAQDISREGSAPGDASLFVPSPEVVGTGTVPAAIMFSQSSDPYSIVLPSLATDHVVTRRSELRLTLGYAFRHRWLFSASLPMVLVQSGDAATGGSTLARAGSGAGLGDANLRLRAVLAATEKRELAMSVEGLLWAPTGERAAYASDDMWRGGLSAIVGGRRARYAWSLEAGGRTRREQIIPGVVPYRIGHESVLGATARVALDNAAHLFVGSELRIFSALSNGAKAFDPKSSHGAWLATLFWRVLGSSLTLTVGLGPGLGQAPGAADWQLVTRAALAPMQDPEPPDGDEDGVPDAWDACRSLAGTPSDDPLMNGCPDLPRDADGDGIPDALDACPIQAGRPSAEPRLHGCPPHAKVVVPRAAPPPAPTVPKAELEAERIVIHQQVQFETGTATLRPESGDVLGEVADILKRHPELELVEIHGHTDETGSDAFNRRLSQERAQSVLTWLVQRGIVAERLVARGFGAEVPLADNTSETGRARNRRVEFHVRKRNEGAPRSEPEEPPP